MKAESENRESGNMTVLHGDAAVKLGELAAGSVHLCVTSPPYDRLRTYGQDRLEWDFVRIAHELFRVLSPGGVLCWIVGDATVNGSETLTSFRQAIYFKDAVGFRIHDTMIYHKKNFGHPSRNRYHQIFEYVFILSKGRPRCFNGLKDKRNAWAGALGTFGRNTIRESDGTVGLRKRNTITPLGMRTNVWHGKTRGQEEMCRSLPHPAMMPKWLARDLILSWSNPGDTVLDPMAGSFTVCQQAVLQGRKAIGIELNAEYLPLSL